MKDSMATIRKNSSKKLTILLLTAAIMLSIVPMASAQPVGPVIQMLSNSTKSVSSGTLIDSTINGTISPGGYVFTNVLTSLQQNTRWKAYVGNVTGTLTLDDALDNTLFQWSLTSVSGEVYATRASGTINWTGINCTWIADGIRNSTNSNLSNRTPEHNENQALSHTGISDNVTATFRFRNHSAFTVGSKTIGKNECFSLQTWQRDRAQTFDDSDNANFTQVILYDGAFNKTNGNVIYETKIENDKVGYQSSETYDFQMMIPENGAPGFSSSTPYYFYVELT